jgi:transcription initiation factor TFIIIB Brf1 subunit/transcription initiation factor TFIIB
MEHLDPTALVVKGAVAAEGVSDADRRRHAWYAAEVAHEAVVRLELGVRTLAIAHSLVHRFYRITSPREFDPQEVAAAAVLLAAKLDDDVRPLSRVGLVVDHVHTGRLHDGRGEGRVLREAGARLRMWLGRIMRAERRLLLSIGFAVYAVTFSPAQTLVPYMARALSLDASTAQAAIAVLNTAGRSSFCLSVCPEVLAAASMHIALEDAGFDVASMGSDWYAVFVSPCGATAAVVQAAIDALRSVMREPLRTPSDVPRSLRAAEELAAEASADRDERTFWAREETGLREVQGALETAMSAGSKRERDIT